MQGWDVLEVGVVIRNRYVDITGACSEPNDTKVQQVFCLRAYVHPPGAQSLPTLALHASQNVAHASIDLHKGSGGISLYHVDTHVTNR